MSSELNTVCKLVKDICETEQTQEYKNALLLIKAHNDKKDYVKEFCKRTNRDVISFKSKITRKRYIVRATHKTRNTVQVPIELKQQYTVQTTAMFVNYSVEDTDNVDIVFDE
jgi:hypothetical protein